MSISFNGYTLTPIISHYNEKGTVALFLQDKEEDDVFAVASVNLYPSTPASINHIFLKNYSENEDLAKFLIDEGYLEPTGTEIKSQWVTFPECRMTTKLLLIAERKSK